MSERRDHAQENISQLAFPNEEVICHFSAVLNFQLFSLFSHYTFVNFQHLFYNFKQFFNFRQFFQFSAILKHSRSVHSFVVVLENMLVVIVINSHPHFNLLQRCIYQVEEESDEGAASSFDKSSISDHCVNIHGNHFSLSFMSCLLIYSFSFFIQWASNSFTKFNGFI